MTQRAKSNDGDTALQKACFGGSLSTVELLVGNGADVNTASSSGMTPLHQASYQGHIEVAEYLLAHGAKINVVDKSGKTAIDYARTKQMVDLLKRAGTVK